MSRWVQNPYDQAFCGEVEFQWTLPCDPSEMSAFRKRIGIEGCEKIRAQVVRLAKREGTTLSRPCEKETRQLKRDTRFARHPKNRKKARRTVKRLKTIAGRVLREVERKLKTEQQQRDDKSK